MPVRKSEFLSANNCILENGVGDDLFDTLINIFNSVKKGGSKYSRFQIEWYIFSGKCLDKTTRTTLDVILQNFEQTVLDSVPGSNEKDFRIYISCVLRMALNCFQKIIILCKKCKEKKSPVTRVVTSFDDTSLHRMAGAMLRVMLRKRFSQKYYKRLTLKRQSLTKCETKLLRQMCLSKAEKQEATTKLSVGFQVLDKGRLLVLKPRILHFVRHFSILFKTNVNTQKYSNLGSQMFKIAKLVTKNSKTTRTMFFDSAINVCGSTTVPDEAIQNVYTEFTEKLFNTMAMNT